MARIKPDNSEDEISFESAMSHLDQIVRKLEGNTLGLDSALAEYAKAVEHVRYCQKQLSGARRKIEKLRGITGRGEPITETWEDENEAE
ncbi:MAG: exodeoxyribonuclease VII small subunit [Pirellula sp.]